MESLDNTNRNFKGQYADEAVCAFTRRHGIVLLPHILGFFILSLTLIVALLSIDFTEFKQLIGPSTTQWGGLLLFCILTYYTHSFFLCLFNFYLTTIIITSSRIIKLDQSIFFKHNRDSIDLRDIRDIVVHKNGFIKTLFNYGEIHIALSSSEETRILSHIPNPTYYFQKINKTKAQYIKNLT